MSPSGQLQETYRQIYEDRILQNMTPSERALYDLWKQQHRSTPSPTTVSVSPPGALVCYLIAVSLFFLLIFFFTRKHSSQDIFPQDITLYDDRTYRWSTPTSSSKVWVHSLIAGIICFILYSSFIAFLSPPDPVALYILSALLLIAVPPLVLSQKRGHTNHEMNETGIRYGTLSLSSVSFDEIERIELLSKKNEMQLYCRNNKKHTIHTGKDDFDFVKDYVLYRIPESVSVSYQL